MKLTPIKTNMTEIQFGNTKVLFSYKTPVASFNIETGKLRRTTKKWSQTTTRHINHWFLSTLPSQGYICGEGLPEEQVYFDSLIDKKKRQ